ncbi:hypothetical protein F4814DRAFT_444923 [Daldinia grandis]|nr:hypothetical protein F4814DRAFT_444923 [Daldinia grandis]
MSVRIRVVLGREEEVEERAINSFLFPKRQHPGKHWMVLKRPQGQGAADKGADTMGLSKMSDYQTVELTVTDIGLILKTLWSRADDIPSLEPVQRVIFHGLVLLFAFGFRQGMIFGMLFRDITLVVVRDPVERHKRRLVATYTIKRNKLKRNALNNKKGETSVFTHLLTF